MRISVARSRRCAIRAVVIASATGAVVVGTSVVPPPARGVGRGIARSTPRIAPERVGALASARVPGATPSPRTPSPGIVSPVGPGRRGGEKLLRVGALVVDRPAGVPAPPAFSAGAFLIADAGSGDVLLAYNSKVQALPASTIKTLTALTLASRLDPATPVKAMPEDAAVDGTKVGIDPGATYTVDQLLNALMMSSANDAAVALARVNGGLGPTVTQMNTVAHELGAVDTIAKNTSGLDATGQVTTAYDLALIGRAALADPRVARIMTTKTAKFPAGRAKRGQARGTYEINNHNRLLWNYDGTVGVKNGYTIKARQTYIGAVRRGPQTYIVTYLAGEVGGWRSTAAMLDWAFAYGPRLQPVGTLNQPPPPAPAASADSDQGRAGGPGGAGMTATLHSEAAAPLARVRDFVSRPLGAAGVTVAALALAVVALRIRAVRRRRLRRHLAGR